MQQARGAGGGTVDPDKPKRRRSYDENLDEPSKLIESEPVDAEAETPREGNVPVESIERDDASGPPAFEDDGTESPRSES